MSRPDSYEFEKMYEYKDEYPYEGAVDEGIEDAEFCTEKFLGLPK